MTSGSRFDAPVSVAPSAARFASCLLASALGAAAFLAAAPVPAEPAAAAVDRLSARLYSRQGELLAAVESGGEVYDEVTFDLGKKGVRNSDPDVVPDGWSCTEAGSAWRCTGEERQVSHFSFRPRGGWSFGDRLELGVSRRGRRLFEQKLPVEPLPPPRVETQLDDLLDVPRRITPGGYLVATPKRAEHRTPGWRLHTGGGTAAGATLDREEIERLPTVHRDFENYAFLVPSGVTDASELSFTYDDPWGARLVDAPLTGVRLTDPLVEPCRRAISACQERAAVGGVLCVCGCFPSALSWTRLTLDGGPIPIPVSAAPFVVRLPLAEGLAPGVHRIAWTSDSAGEGAVSFEAVRVGGSIDQERLRVGQSTRLEFVVEGTEASLAMDIEKTAGKVGIQGGNKQTAYTSGGATNNVRRMLLALGVGDFGIHFGIDLPACPCESLDDAPGGERAVHSLSLEGASGLTAPTLGMETSVRFSAQNVVGLTPRPPISRQGIEVEVAQLGLEAETSGLGEFLFETRAEQPSIGRFSRVRLDPRGYFFGGDLDLDLHTEFSVLYDPSLPLEVGGRYEMGLSDWSFTGTASELGSVGFRARPDQASGVVFHDIRKDAAGTQLFGYADFTLRGQLEIDSDVSNTP